MVPDRQHRHVCHLIPDFIQAAVAKNAGSGQRALAIHNIQLDSSFRQARLGFNEYNRPKFAALREERQASGLSWFGSRIGGFPNRSIYTSNETEIEPGMETRAEGAPPSQKTSPVIFGQPYSDEINEAYSGMGATYNLYWEVYGRNSIDPPPKASSCKGG